MKPSSFRDLVALGATLLSPAATALAADVDFERDVYPVLQRACVECHGAEKKKGGLRLDVREAAFQGGENGAVIVKGKPDASELVRRIALPKSDDEVMPSRGEPLAKTEIESIRAWIASGAPWPDGVKLAKHWAYVVPTVTDEQKAKLKAQSSKFKVQNPIDGFIRARLEREGMQASPDAEPQVLARRLFLDLIGLPPTPAEADAFVQSATRDLQSAIESLADGLLGLPQYGEKWARPWLDVARYADSHGFQRDDLRELWPYRDWVIRALNADMPFDQFTIEQLAGDLLPNATEQQRIATGFNRCTPCNVEAGTDPEENRVNQVFDRVNTLGAVWLGTTIECAQCHDHKFDPVTARDYYGLFAFFNQTELEADRANPKVPGSIKFNGPYMNVSAPEQDAEAAALRAEIAKVKAALAARQPGAKPIATTAATHPLTPVDFDSAGDSTHKILEDGSVLLLGDAPSKDTYTVTVRTPLTRITGFKLEALTDPTLPGMGPGRGDPKRTNFVLNTFAVTAAPAGREGDAKPVRLTDAHADYSQNNWDVSGAIDDNPKSGWAIGGRFHEPHWATFRTAQPLGFEGGTVLTFRLVQDFGQARTIGRLRLSALTGDAEPATPKADLEKTRLAAQLTALEKREKAFVKPRTLIMQEVPQPRASAIFQRGDFRSPGAAIEPSVPSALHPLRDDGPRNRLALARWLVSRDNPLTARVVVNRLWMEIFGEGLVSTPEDFGTKGERPTHPELLDWLAVEFMDGGWSQKKLLRQIITSAAYRQTSRATPAAIERDPRNLLLARGPAFRLSAESIRDNALAISGLLNPKQFGPPIQPPQPDGLWEKVGGQKYEYTVSPGEEQHRRGIYVVLKRMSPYPSFINFDGTARLACRLKRLRSNTPLQALTLLNDPVYVEAARAFAARIVREQPTSDVDARLRHAFRLAVARPPRDSELAVLRKLYDGEFAAGKEDAAWFAVASTLLNLDETITKN